MLTLHQSCALGCCVDVRSRSVHQFGDVSIGSVMSMIPHQGHMPGLRAPSLVLRGVQEAASQ